MVVNAGRTESRQDLKLPGQDLAWFTLTYFLHDLPPFQVLFIWTAARIDSGGRLPAASTVAAYMQHANR